MKDCTSMCLLVRCVYKLYFEHLECARNIIKITLTQSENVPTSSYQLYLVLCEIANQRDFVATEVYSVIKEMRDDYKHWYWVMDGGRHPFMSTDIKVLNDLRETLDICIDTGAMFSYEDFDKDVISRYYEDYRNVLRFCKEMLNEDMTKVIVTERYKKEEMYV